MLFFARPSSSQSASQNASSRGSVRSLFRLPAATASRLRQTELLDLGEQLVGDLDAAGARRLLAREAPRPRQPHLGSASIAETMVSTRSENFSVPASADGSTTMKDWPMRGRLPCSEKNESASAPMAAPV